MKYYGTFGQSHLHPVTGERMKDYWVEIYVDHVDERWERHRAISLMASEFGSRWSMVYNREYFDKSMFPKGCYTVLGKKSDEDELDDLLEEIYDKRKNNREAERIRDSDNQLLS